MERKTQAVYDLTEKVLQTLSSPYSEHIIDEVFFEIQQNSEWLQTYEEQKAFLGEKVINSRIGRYVKEITGMRQIQKVKAKRSTLIKDYSILSYSVG